MWFIYPGIDLIIAAITAQHLNCTLYVETFVQTCLLMFPVSCGTLDGKICNIQKACAGFECLHTEISAVTVAYGDAGIMEPEVFHWELCCSSTHMLT